MERRVKGELLRKWEAGCVCVLMGMIQQKSSYWRHRGDNCPDVAIRPLLHFPHLPRAGPILLTLQLFPLVTSSYWVLSGSIYFFLLVRCSCPLPDGVLHALLCLKVYSWCICGEIYSMSTYFSTILFSPHLLSFLPRITSSVSLPWPYITF